VTARTPAGALRRCQAPATGTALTVPVANYVTVGNVNGQRPTPPPKGIRIGRDMPRPQSLLDEWTPVPKRPLIAANCANPRRRQNGGARCRRLFRRVCLGEALSGRVLRRAARRPRNPLRRPRRASRSRRSLHSSDGPMSTGGPHQRSSLVCSCAESHIYGCRASGKLNMCGTTGGPPVRQLAGIQDGSRRVYRVTW
jgi:hypothetical protein